MMETLEELKKIMEGIIGTFVIDERGEVAAHDLPKIMTKKAGKTAKLIYYVTSVMRATRPFDRIIIESENLEMIAMMAKGRILVVFANRGVNLPLLKLVSNIALTRLREEKDIHVTKGYLGIKEINNICNFYDVLYGVAAKKLSEIFGPEEASGMFSKKVHEVKSDHPKLLSNVSFAKNGKPKTSQLKMNATELTREDFIAGLEDLLVSMLETLKDHAGPIIADKAIDDIIRIKEDNKKSI